MKTLLAYIWNRRWCRIVLSITVLLGLASLHPFGRQSIFGPKVGDIPWCVWEDEIRIAAQPGPPKRGWFQDLMIKLRPPEPDLFKLKDNETSLPVYIHLANDNDVNVRRYVLEKMGVYWWKKHGAEITPVLRRCLEDDDPLCRLYAVHGVWTTTKDRELKTIVLPLVDHNDDLVRVHVASLLSDMAVDDPELWNPLLRLTGDRYPYVRGHALVGMGHFGMRGLPFVRAGLIDSDANIRGSAIQACISLKKEASSLIPDLIALQNDPDPWTRKRVQNALTEIDPKRFPATQK
jgi:hypothetical protein